VDTISRKHGRRGRQLACGGGDIPVDFWGKLSTATHNLAIEFRELADCCVVVWWNKAVGWW